MIQYNHRYRRHSLITSTVITGGISIAAFASRGPILETRPILR